MSIIDNIYQRMQDDTEIKPKEMGESELVKFYSNINIFLTGATDIIGKCLIEKLLRDCNEIKKIYILLRVKNSEDFDDKCKKFFNDDIFSELRRINPNFKDKIIPLKGDLTLEKVGLSDTDYRTITENVDMIFHNGSATKLDEKVSIALKTNIYGTKRMLELAKECKHLKSFLYVSTAYSHCPQRIIEEKFYNAPADLKAIDDMIAADTETGGLTRDALSMLLGDWPNIYTFSKAISEELIQQHAFRSSYACCVFRPTVVISTYKEPMPGWCDVKNGPASFFIKIAKGAIHVVYKADYPCDLIPADFCANAILVCAWDAIDRWQIEPGAFVYNYGTSTEKPINMVQIKDKMAADPSVFATNNTRRLPYVIFSTNMLMYIVMRVIFDYVPAFIIDILSFVHGHQPQSWNLVRESMTEMCRMQRFVRGNYRVRIPETLKACERLNERDRQLFICDVRQLDWDDYFLTYWRGIRAHVLRESPDNDTNERRRCPYASNYNNTDTASRCPCKCPCKCPCICISTMIAMTIFAYYFVKKLFFD